jgi:3-dehydroquinate dehydratase II
MAASSKIMLLNGPNLNMLGVREPEIYGSDTLDDIRATCLAKAASLGIEVDFRQSNSEGELVGWIQSARGDHDGVIINPAAYTHTSIAIMDALIAAELPVIELHLSNPLRREAFRHHSYVSGVAHGVICGFGGHGYELALDAMARIVGVEGDGA